MYNWICSMVLNFVYTLESLEELWKNGLLTSESESEIGAATTFKSSQGDSSAQPGLRTSGINTLALPIMLTCGNVCNICIYAIHTFTYTQRENIKCHFFCMCDFYYNDNNICYNKANV